MIPSTSGIALQPEFDPGPSGIEVAFNLGGSAGSAFLTTLVVGGIVSFAIGAAGFGAGLARLTRTPAGTRIGLSPSRVFVDHMTHDVPIRVDHVGIAVESVADAEPVLLALGCEKMNDETVEDRFRWVYYRLGDASRVELIEPIEDDSFLTGFLAENGPGLHHVTLEVADLDTVADSLEAEGIRVVDRAEFDTWTEAFVSPGNPTGTLFQLMEYHEDYPEGRDPPEELFVNGGRVEEVAAHE